MTSTVFTHPVSHSRSGQPPPWRRVARHPQWGRRDGALDFFELSELDESEIGTLRAYETVLADLLSMEDVEAVAAAVEPGSTAALLVWENTWAAPFASAVRRAGGQLAATGRIPVQAILAAIEADDEEEEGD